MRESFDKLDKFNKAQRGGVRHSLEQYLDPSKQSDRLLFAAYEMSCLVILVSPREMVPVGISRWVQRIEHELSGLVYSKDVENWLSGMALLNELHVSWQWRQMTDYHDPLDEKLVTLEINSRNMLPANFKFRSKENLAAMSSTAGDLECGQTMRAFCEIPPPKGVKDLAWLRKMTDARKHLHETWRLLRASWNDRESDVGRSQLFRTSVLSCMSFYESPEYLARIDTERHRIEENDQSLKTARKERQLESQFVRQAWDTGADGSSVVKKTLTKKTNASRNDVAIDGRLRKLSLSNKPLVKSSGSNAASAPMPLIAVKQKTLSVLSKVFPTGADGSSGVRWTQLLQALADAEMRATQGAGSAVSFANEHGSISLHKPHPDPVVDAVMLRGIGRPLNNWFGWNHETFVLREKGKGEASE
jgi:hypothetical protein